MNLRGMHGGRCACQHSCSLAVSPPVLQRQPTPQVGINIPIPVPLPFFSFTGEQRLGDLCQDHMCMCGACCCAKCHA